MVNVIAMRERPAIVEELAQHLICGRVDLAAEERAFQFLYNLNLWPWRVVSDNLDAAIDRAGQHWISRAIERRAAGAMQ